MAKLGVLTFEELKRGVAVARSRRVVDKVTVVLQFRDRRALDAFKEYRGCESDEEAVVWLVRKGLRTYL